MLRFEFMVAWRFLKEARSQTLLILAGITIGVAVQIFLSSLIGGLQDNLVASTVGNSPHIVLESFEDPPRSILGERGNPQTVVLPTVRAVREDSLLLSWQPLQESLSRNTELTASSPLAQGSGFLARGSANRPVVVKGVDFPQADRIYRVTSRMVEGEARLGGTGILVGKGLASDLSLTSGDSVQVSTADGASATFTVNGVFDLETQVVNDSWVFMDLSRAQALFNFTGALTRIEMQIPEVFQSERIAERLKREFPGYRVETWQTQNQQLLAALQSQSASSLMIQFFVLLAVTLGIASVLAITAVQKSKEIGILKAMGARTASASRIFLLQGAILGITGSIMGSLVGTGLIQAFTLLTESTGGALTFTVRVDPSNVLALVIISTTASTFAAIYPARKAAKLVPIEVIKTG